MQTGFRMRSNYSPIRQMSLTPAKQQQQQLDTHFPTSKYTSEKHQHRQQDTYWQERNKQSEFEDQEEEETEIKRVLDQDQEGHANSPIQEGKPELVYICDCCGISGELEPTFKYMSTFLSLFCLFNFLVFSFGLANLGMGLWFRIDPKVYEIHKYIETQNFTIAGWIMLFGGFTACITSIVGFAGAIKQSTSVMALYLAIMIPLTIGFVGTLVLLVVHGLGITLEDFFIKEVYEQMRLRSMDNEFDWFSLGGAAQFLDFIQVKMRCCGAIDFTDYEKLGLIVPTTCYTIDRAYINAPGCGRAMREIFDLRAGMASGFISGSIAVQLMTVILAGLMLCSIYHSRAQPKTVLLSDSATPYRDSPIKDIPLQQNIYQQKSRSRTPIVI